MNIKLNYLKCGKCGHEWLPRTKKVVVCPRCHSYKWHPENKKNEKHIQE